MDERRAWIECVGDLLIKLHEQQDEMGGRGEMIYRFASVLIKPFNQP